MASFFGSLMSGGITGPNALINTPGMGPLPSVPGGTQFSAGTLAQINMNKDRLFGNGLAPYAGPKSPGLINVQTQVNVPNRVQVVISKLFIPSAQADFGTQSDPILEHALSDGDIAFSLRMNPDMIASTAAYAIAPRGYAAKSAQLINLTTANYILWGLQVGAEMHNGRRWKTFFSNLCRLELVPYQGKYSQEVIFNFLQSYISPFGVQLGSDMQGGLHEGNRDPFINATDYIAAFAIEGKLEKVLNHWRCSDISEDDDLILELRYMEPQTQNIQFNLSSSVRSNRTELCPVPRGWWYLEPTVLRHRSIIDSPYVHVGRALKWYSAYGQKRFGLDLPPWNARACILGLPIELTFEPCFVSSDDMFLRDYAGIPISNAAEGVQESEPSTTTSIRAGDTGIRQLQHTYTGKRAAPANNPPNAAPGILNAPPTVRPLANEGALGPLTAPGIISAPPLGSGLETKIKKSKRDHGATAVVSSTSL